MISTLMGWLGTVVLVGTYYSLTTGVFVERMTHYHIAIAIGCLLLGFSSAAIRNWPSVAVQTFFITIAAWAVYHPTPVPAASEPLIEVVHVIDSAPGPPKKSQRFSCAEVRKAVKDYGAAVVEQEARRRGMLEAEIQRVKRACKI